MDTFDSSGNIVQGSPEYQEPDAARAQLVKELCGKVKHAKEFHKEAFKKMREDMEVALAGTSKSEFKNGKKYVANIIQRHIAQRVSTLYAKNPKAVADRRERRSFRVWDGSIQTLMAAQQDLMTAGGGVDPQTGAVMPPRMPNPQSIAILQDYQQGMAERKMIDAVGDTLVKLFHYFLDEQTPNFKGQMKKLVRRTITTGVGYVKIGFQRDMKRRPEVDAQIADITNQLARIERLMNEMAEGEISNDDAEAEELRLMLQTLQNMPLMIVREGLVFDFPSSTSIIIDPDCKHLRGFVGAGWIAHEIMMSPEDVEETYGVDLGKGSYTCYNRNGEEQRISGAAWRDTRDPNNPMCCVWEFYDKMTGQVYALCDGYKDFLEEPGAPNVTLERFFPIYPLVFNDIESDKEIFAPSDTRLLVPMQDEHNRSREGLREHRMAARPKYVAPKGLIEEQDKENLKRHVAHSVLEVNIAPGQKVADLIQPVPLVGVDPNLYVTNHLMEDVQLVVGGQEASLFGATSGVTATESSIAQGTQTTSIQSNIDDFDDFFTELARDAGQILMLEMSEEKVREIVGPGAVWPQMSREQVAKEIFLKVQAGSSGRPNKAAELANLERVLPYLIQIPGIPPEWLAKQVLMRLDDRLDLTDAFDQSLPSISAMNSQKQIGTGDPTTDPNSQGAQGSNNAPKAQSSKSGSSAPMGSNNMSGV